LENIIKSNDISIKDQSEIINQNNSLINKQKSFNDILSLEYEELQSKHESLNE